MKITTLAVAVVVAFGLVSCNENEPPKPQPKNTFLESLQQGKPVYSQNVTTVQPAGVQPAALQSTGAQSGLDLSGVTVSGKTAVEKAPVEPAIQIPADARWTLYCLSVAGPDRFSRISQLKSTLVAKSGLKEWYVVHNEQDSTLFYGFYPAVEKDLPGSARAHADQKMIQAMKDDQGDKMFPKSLFTPITPANPVAPAEWNLVNAPSTAYWSLQIGAFKGNPLRKQAAVEQVKELRAKGVEAFYYHGDSISSVCIGAWPRTAIKEQDDDKGRSVSSNDDVLVSADPLPERYRNAKGMTSADGHKIVPYAQRVEIADPSLQATMTEYPNHWVNYQMYSTKRKNKDGTEREVLSPSLLVVIPRQEPSALSGGDAMPGVASEVVGPPPVDPMRQRGTGRLRALDR
jgi:hypothetical protein